MLQYAEVEVADILMVIHAAVTAVADMADQAVVATVQVPPHQVVIPILGEAGEVMAEEQVDMEVQAVLL